MTGKGRILICDYGTTALKTVLYDENMNLIGMTSRELSYEYPYPGHVEFEAEKYWELVVDTVREILSRTESHGTVEIISLTSQAETLIPVDVGGKPLRKALVWLDNRADEQNNRLKSCLDIDTFYRHTGLNAMDPIFPLNKMAWIKENEKEIYDRTYKFLLLKDFILFKLTGQYVSDPSICSCSGCFDIRRRQWWKEAFDVHGIDMDKVPEIRETAFVLSEIGRETANFLGLSKNVRVMNGMLDQCGSAIGAGNTVPGVVTETTGTAIVLASTLDDPEKLDFTGGVPVVCHGIPGKYLALPYCQTAGIILKWFKDNFCMQEAKEAETRDMSVYRLLDKLAESVEGINPKLVMLPHFCGSMSPVNKPDAVGALFGLSLNTGKADIVKAIMESIGFLLKENVEFLESNGFPVKEVISLGGGANSAIWLQIKSDILRKKVIALAAGESTSLGCALVAGISTGYIKSVEEILKQKKSYAEYIPYRNRTEAYEHKYQLYLKLYKACESLYEG